MSLSLQGTTRNKFQPRENIWLGVYQADLVVETSDDEKEAQLREVLWTMLERFPP